MQTRHLLFILFAIFLNFKGNAQSDSATLAQSRIRALTLDSIIRANPDKQTTNFSPTDHASLPIGICKKIGDIIYVICIDSARFTPQGATFDVYMAMDWPGAYGKLAFAAKGVSFNPKGVMPGGNGNPITLKLLGDQRIKLGPKNSIVFKGDGTNYIQWGCNGYERANINADILFSQELIHKPGGGQVKANIQVNVDDISKIMFQTSMDPFVVKGLDDFEFRVNQLIVDRNDSINPSGIILPAATQNLYPEIGNWTGFYAHNLSVKLPPKLSRSSGETTIGVTDLLIDDNGVSGDFFATGIFSVGEGDMDSWGFSIDSLVLGIEYNHLVDGRLAGKLRVEPLNNAEFAYRAGVYKPNDNSALIYDFTAKTVNSYTYQLPMFSSTLKLAPNCMVHVQVVSGKFIPDITLNGNLTYNGAKARLNKLLFQSLNIGTQAPYIYGGTFALTSDEIGEDGEPNKVARLPISLNYLELGLTQSNVILKVDLSLKLGGEENSNSFGASTFVGVITKRVTGSDGRQRLQFDKFKVYDIALSINTSPFALNGILSLRDDDPVYGDMFFGAISFKLNAIMNDFAGVSVGFGKLNSKRYWYVDASVPLTIPIGQFALITNLFGGVQYGVKSTLTPAQKLDRAFNGAMNPSQGTPTSSAIPFIPDPSLGLGFSAGVALVAIPGESVLNGEAIFSIQFNANGGLANINFFGRATMLVKRSERGANCTKVEGAISVNYDNVEKVFDAQVDALAIVPGILQGNCNLKIHIDKHDWYFWLNRPSNRATIEVLNLFTANTYFMIGTQIDPMPPPPSYVTNLVSSSPIISTDMSAVSTGNGFATGMMIAANFGGEFPKETNWRGYAYASVGAGFDITMFKLSPTAHCSGSTSKVGFNNWYLMGQVYAWLSGGMGVRHYKDDGTLKKEYSVASIDAAALLQGRLPKPTFVYGAVGFSVKLLGIINLDFQADIEIGNDCQIIN